MPKTPDPDPATDGDDPWEGFTPDQFTDSVADKVFARMAAAQQDAGKDDGGGDPPADPPPDEKPPANTSKWGGLLDWWQGAK